MSKESDRHAKMYARALRARGLADHYYALTEAEPATPIMLLEDCAMDFGEFVTAVLEYLLEES